MKLTDKRYKLERGICSYIMWITIIAKNNVFLSHKSYKKQDPIV